MHTFVSFTFKLPPEMLAAILDIVEATGRNKSYVARDLLARGLKSYAAEKARKEKKHAATNQGKMDRQ